MALTTPLLRAELSEPTASPAVPSPTPYQDLLTALGKFLLSIDIEHVQDWPMAEVTVWFPAEWLLPFHPYIAVEGKYLSEEATVYVLKPDPEHQVHSHNYSGPAPLPLDELVAYIQQIIHYNDELEVKKLELERLLREHKAKLEAQGVKIRQVEVKKPTPEPAPEPGPWPFKTEAYPFTDRQAQPPASPHNPEPPLPIPTQRRLPQLPAGIDPAIFAEEQDEPLDYQAQPPRPATSRPMPPRPAEEPDGPRLVAPPVEYDRDTPIRQRHEDEY